MNYLFSKIDISRDLELVRNSLIKLNSLCLKSGWNESRENRFIELCKKEDDLVLKLIA